jgi:hypothetical protein
VEEAEVVVRHLWKNRAWMKLAMVHLLSGAEEAEVVVGFYQKNRAWVSLQ